MADNLKPCPFCGGDNIDIIPADIIAGTQYWRIYCYGCGCTQTPTSNKEDAIEAWNKRPNPWHTGTPTEEGWYLIQTKRVDVDTGRYIFKVGNLSDVLWFQSEGYKELSCYGIIAWQKIEPYKEATE